MSWWESIKNVASTIWVKTHLKKFTVETLKFTYNTVAYLTQQIPATVYALRALVVQPKTRNVAKHLGRIAAEDLAPLVLLNGVNDLIQTYGKEYLDAPADSALMSISTALQLGLALCNGAMWVYSKRAKAQMLVRMAAVTIELGQALPEKKDENNVCIKEKCTSMRFLGGSARDLCVFYATEGAIALIRFAIRDIPFGEQATMILELYHNGRYMTSIVSKDQCQRHQLEYLKQYPELPFALGISHKGVVALTSNFLEASTGISKVYYQPTLSQLYLLAHVIIAAQMLRPKSVKKADRNYLEPFDIYSRFIGFIVDTFALGLKKQIPLMLKEKKSTIPWNEIRDMIFVAWQHPAANVMKKIFLPPMLRNLNALIHDPVIAPNWDIIRKALVTGLETFLKKRETYAVKAAINLTKHIPKQTAFAMWAIFGTPKSVIELLIKLAGNDNFIAAINDLRRQLVGMHTDELSLPLRANQHIPLRNASTEKNAQLDITTEKMLHKNFLPHPEDVLKKKKLSEGLGRKAREEISIQRLVDSKKSSHSTVVNPREIIRRTAKQQFFADKNNVSNDKAVAKNILSKLNKPCIN